MAPASRRLWSARSTAPGARRSEVPGLAALNSGGYRRDRPRCRALRRATAARAALRRQHRPLPGVRGQPGQRHLGHGGGGPRHRHPQPGRERRDPAVVVRLGGQLQRGRILLRQLRRPSAVRGQRGRRHLGHGAGGPRIATLTRQGAAIYPVSCASAGNCSAGGLLHRQLRRPQAFGVIQVNGTWRKAEEVPGTAALNKPAGLDPLAFVCPGGQLQRGRRNTDQFRPPAGFVVSQVHGTWGEAGNQVPGPPGPQQGRQRPDQPDLSCGSARQLQPRPGTTPPVPATPRHSWSAGPERRYTRQRLGHPRGVALTQRGSARILVQGRDGYLCRPSDCSAVESKIAPLQARGLMATRLPPSGRRTDRQHGRLCCARTVNMSVATASAMAAGPGITPPPSRPSDRQAARNCRYRTAQQTQ